MQALSMDDKRLSNMFNSVVGFIDASFSGVEQGPGYNVLVGYQKGAAVAGQNLVFNVISTPDTASEFMIIRRPSNQVDTEMQAKWR